MIKKSAQFYKTFRGFTLIELLIVIVIIATLAVAVYAALNPVKRLSDTRNARRTQDVDTILTAIHEYIADNKGALPTGLSATEQQLGTAATGCTISTGGCNVTTTACLDLVTPLANYLKAIPVDPILAINSTTNGYSAVANANGIVTVTACDAESGLTIQASR